MCARVFDGERLVELGWVLSDLTGSSARVDLSKLLNLCCPIGQSESAGRVRLRRAPAASSRRSAARKRAHLPDARPTPSRCVTSSWRQLFAGWGWRWFGSRRPAARNSWIVSRRARARGPAGSRLRSGLEGRSEVESGRGRPEQMQTRLRTQMQMGPQSVQLRARGHSCSTYAGSWSRARVPASARSEN